MRFKALDSGMRRNDGLIRGSLEKSFQPRKHTEATETQRLPGVTLYPLAGDGGAGVKLMILSVFFRVIPWQMQFIGLTFVNGFLTP